MKKALIIALFIIALAGGLYYMYTKGTLPGMSDGAYDDADRQTYNRMVDAIRTSAFAADADYIVNSYKAAYAPGKDMAPADSYGTIAGKPTMSSGLTRSVWNAWLGTYLGTPKEASARALANQIAGMWEAYRNKTALQAIR